MGMKTKDLKMRPSGLQKLELRSAHFLRKLAQESTVRHRSCVVVLLVVLSCWWSCQLVNWFECKYPTVFLLSKHEDENPSEKV
jgi:hypothetical protein